jgi:hypothetical protein
MRWVPWRVIGILVALALCGTVVVLGFQRFVLGVKAENRHALYAIQRELRKDMTRHEVEAIVAGHQDEHLRIRWSPQADSVTVSTIIGFFQGCDLRVRFQNERLVSATVRGDDTPDQRLSDAPADIE